MSSEEIQENKIHITINFEIYILNETDICESIFFKTLAQNIGVMKTDEEINICNIYENKIESKYVNDIMKWLEIKDIWNLIGCKLSTTFYKYESFILSKDNKNCIYYKNNDITDIIINYYYVADFLQIDELKNFLKNKINEIFRNCVLNEVYVKKKWNMRRIIKEYIGINSESEKYVLPHNYYHSDINHERYDGDDGYIKSCRNMTHIIYNKLYLLKNYISDIDKIENMLQQYSDEYLFCLDTNDYYQFEYVSNNYHGYIGRCFDNLADIYNTYEKLSMVNLKFLSNSMYLHCNISSKFAEQLLMFNIIDENNIENMIIMLDMSTWIHRNVCHSMSIQWTNINEANKLFENTYANVFADKVKTFLSIVILNIWFCTKNWCV